MELDYLWIETQEEGVKGYFHCLLLLLLLLLCLPLGFWVYRKRSVSVSLSQIRRDGGNDDVVVRD